MSLNALHDVTNRLCEIVDALHKDFPPPTVVAQGDGFVDRHAPGERTNVLAGYLKAVKACSTLNGALVLLGRAYVQEAYALGRIVQEQSEDIQFLIVPRGEDDRPTKLQDEVLTEFYQEEFGDAMDPIGTSQPRKRPDRQKIRAAIHQDIEDPSTAGQITKAINRIFSGYVHGAYVHVMELHSNTPGRYILHGGQGAHLTEAIDYFPQFIFSTALAVELLVECIPRTDLLPRIEALRKEIGMRFDLMPKGKKA